MSLKIFLQFVEIQTKVASVVPFILGTMYAVYRFDAFNLRNFIWMFIATLSFDMAATAINNYLDYKKAYKKYGYNYETHNAIVKYNISEKTIVLLIGFLLFFAILFGFLLYKNTSIAVLLLGGISFAVGILYSFGPVPISRMPLGEIVSGFFMGFVIVLLSSYIHIYDLDIIGFYFYEGVINIHFIFDEIVYMFLIAVPVSHGIANIMLANNICDIEDDISNKRYTLPVFIGKEKSLKLFKILYYFIYLILFILLILRILPLISGFVIMTIIIIQKNINLFEKKQTKEETFILSVKNFLWINVVYICTIGMSVLFN